MGYLHDGHRSLMRAARAASDFVVVTIFVNPLQFGPQEDLDRYPRDLAGDLAACEAEGVDCVFAPSVAEMYPRPSLTTVHVADLTTDLCGALASHTLRRRHDRCREAVRDRRTVRGVLRPQGRAAARGRDAHGRRPEPAGGRGRLPDRAGGRQAGHVEPQRVPLRRRPRRGADALRVVERRGPGDHRRRATTRNVSSR